MLKMILFGYFILKSLLSESFKLTTAHVDNKSNDHKIIIWLERLFIKQKNISEWIGPKAGADGGENWTRN
jgi:hypothetical protein